MRRINVMSKVKRDFFKLSNFEQQKLPHPDEIDPNNTFMKTSIASSRAADRYRLKGLKFETNQKSNKE